MAVTDKIIESIVTILKEQASKLEGCLSSKREVFEYETNKDNPNDERIGELEIQISILEIAQESLDSAINSLIDYE